MFSLDEFHRTYATVTTPVSLDTLSLQLFTPASIDRFIDPDDIMTDFPLWAKIWEASGVLATYLAKLVPDPHKTMLEIGCGLGMVGIAAAKAGHRVTMTERNPDALNFARANAWVNGCPDLPVEPLDWNEPTLDTRYDYIVGAETVYKTEDIEALTALFDRYLNPDGVVILAETVRRTGVAFWERMRARFAVQAQRHTLRSAADTQHVILFRLQSKA